MSNLRKGCWGAILMQDVWLIPGSHAPLGSNYPEGAAWLAMCGFMIAVGIFGK